MLTKQEVASFLLSEGNVSFFYLITVKFDEH